MRFLFIIIAESINSKIFSIVLAKQRLYDDYQQHTALFVESERFELSSREGHYRIFYMLSRMFIFESYQVTGTQITPRPIIFELTLRLSSKDGTDYFGTSAKLIAPGETGPRVVESDLPELADSAEIDSLLIGLAESAFGSLAVELTRADALEA